MTQSNLADACNNRIRGDRAENIEQAIEHYQPGPEGLHPEQPSQNQWAMTQNNLANAYNNRIRGDRAENIELAIWHCGQALKV